MTDLQQLRARHDDLKRRNISIDMTRGKPSPEQLDLSDQILTLVGPGDCIGGANAAETEWPPVKVALQIAAIRLRQVNTNDGPKMLTPEHAAATAQKLEVATDPELAEQPPSRAESKDGVAGTADTDDPTKPDASGYVFRPTDLSAYVPMTTILAKHCEDVAVTTTKALTKVLENFSTNRVRWTRPLSKKTGAPHRQRRSVHLADWEHFVDRQKRQGPGTSDDGFPNLAPGEIGARTAKVRRRRSPGK